NLNADGAIATGASILNSQALTDVGGGGPAVPSLTPLLVNRRAPAATAPPLVAAGDVITIAGKRGGRDLPPLNYTVAAGGTGAGLCGFLDQGVGGGHSGARP